HGTYPLPEAQLDRFAMQLAMGYPPPEEELAILSSQDSRSPLESVEAVTNPEEVLEVQAKVRQLHVDEDVGRYVVAILQATRNEPRIALGVSPRGGIVLRRMAQAHAFLAGREATLPDDVKAVAVPCLAHRLVLETKAKYSGVTKEGLVAEVLERVKVPV
ncbi:MoxR family ATPase, partial [Planctomycetota bacterium]|nr:MoxR family ATPase [Planctomycetota bacterium]